jgi:hypothetical protein
MESLFAYISFYLDGTLILLYRISGHPLVDYFIGTFLLGLICVIIGELTVSLALRFNKPYLDELTGEMLKKEALSIEAYKAGDKTSYRALNKVATDAWGKRFFTMVAYSAGMLWPIPFALGWMQTRFNAIEFQLAFPLSLAFGTVGYTFTFIPLYILGRILFKYLRPWLPYFRGVQRRLDEYGSPRERQAFSPPH